jgi:hypothetical protein
MKSAKLAPPYFGLLRRKEVWALTWRGKLLMFVLSLAVGFTMLAMVHGFLALNSPVNSGVLVIEGWVPEYALTNFIAHARYERIYTTGGPTLTDRYSKDDSDTYASVSMQRLLKAGVPLAKVKMVPCWISQRDRTYAAVVALQRWAATNGVALDSFDVVTLDVHARRSRLLTQKAFPHAKVGVIPLVNEEYEPDKWWRYSEGVKEVMAETAAYFYARFVFSPE